MPGEEMIRFEFCEDFTCCYECGMLNAISKFCRVCKKYC